MLGPITLMVAMLLRLESKRETDRFLARLLRWNSYICTVSAAVQLGKDIMGALS